MPSGPSPRSQSPYSGSGSSIPYAPTQRETMQRDYSTSAPRLENPGTPRRPAMGAAVTKSPSLFAPDPRFQSRYNQVPDQVPLYSNPASPVTGSQFNIVPPPSYGQQYGSGGVMGGMGRWEQSMDPAVVAGMMPPGQIAQIPNMADRVGGQKWQQDQAAYERQQNMWAAEKARRDQQNSLFSADTARGLFDMTSAGQLYNRWTGDDYRAQAGADAASDYVTKALPDVARRIGNRYGGDFSLHYDDPTLDLASHLAEQGAFAVTGAPGTIGKALGAAGRAVGAGVKAIPGVAEGANAVRGLGQAGSAAVMRAAAPYAPTLSPVTNFMSYAGPEIAAGAKSMAQGVGNLATKGFTWAPQLGEDASWMARAAAQMPRNAVNSALALVNPIAGVASSPAMLRSFPAQFIGKTYADAVRSQGLLPEDASIGDRLGDLGKMLASRTEIVPANIPYIAARTFAPGLAAPGFEAQQNYMNSLLTDPNNPEQLHPGAVEAYRSRIEQGMSPTDAIQQLLEGIGSAYQNDPATQSDRTRVDLADLAMNATGWRPGAVFETALDRQDKRDAVRPLEDMFQEQLNRGRSVAHAGGANPRVEGGM